VSDAIKELVYRSCLLLDARDFEGFLALCHANFRYTVRAYSPEIRRDMVWLDHDRSGIEALFRTLPRHHSDPSPLTRHVTVYTVTIDEAAARANVVSALQVFRTALDGGATHLFAIGKLYDTVSLDDGVPHLAKREVQLDTRALEIGTHIPL
jgi:methanesulfonate monooxygenase small subunit